MANERPLFLSEKEAAKYLGMAPMTLYQMRKNPGKTSIPIPYIRLGNRIRYEERRLIAWLRAHEVNRMPSIAKGGVAATRERGPAKRGPGRPKAVMAAPAAAIKRGPGRPPKACADAVAATGQKPGPGRPKKQPQLMAAAVLKKRKVKKK